MENGKTTCNKLLYVFLIFFILVFVLAIIYSNNGVAWIALLISIFLSFIAIGCAKGKWNRIFVDERNQMSLSRFQIVIWTLIILSAFLTIALSRIALFVKTGNPVDPLLITMDWQLFAILGISVTSLVGTPLILDTKKGKDPSSKEVEKAAKTLDKDVDIEYIEDNSTGLVYRKEKPEDASFSDMFTGDEIADMPYINMAKVQMFFFTIILAFAYGVMLFELINKGNIGSVQVNFPELTDSFVALLGISHASYLTQKTIDHTNTAKN